MPSKRKPGYLLHKPTGQARVRIDGRDHYLGPYGSPESRERYEDLIAEWFAKQGDVTAYTLQVDELCLMFMNFADGYYRRRDGTATGTVGNIRSALKYPVQLFGTIRVRDFGPRKLKAVRQAMIEDGRCRTNIPTPIQQHGAVGFFHPNTREFSPARAKSRSSTWTTLKAFHRPSAKM